MKILLACVHFSVSSGRYITRALKRLGHDVKTVGPAPGRMIWGMEVEAKYEWKPDILIRQHELDSTLPTPMVSVQEILGDWKPELVITADSVYTLLGVENCPHVLWGQDNHVRDYHYNLPGGFNEFDAMFMAHSWGARMDEPNAYWLPPCYDPEACTDLGLERSIDVTIIGYPYEDRVKIISAMKEAGLNTFASIGAIWDEYNAIYNHSKIALVKSIAGDVTNRFLENRAQGCCVLADRPKDAEKMGFVAGVDYWPFEDTEGAVREAKFLLSTGLWQNIARHGKSAGKSHTWDKRCEVVLRWLEDRNK